MVFDYLFKNARIFSDGKFRDGEVAVSGGKIVGSVNVSASCRVVDLRGALLLPSFADVHVHFREPGFTYKETIATGSRAAAAGGYTDVWTMPNLNPVPDSPEHLKVETDAIAAGSVINTHPIASITVGEMGKELTDMEALAPNCAAFSDDGRGVQDDGMMREALVRAKALGRLITAHCEVNSLLVKGGSVHDGEWARSKGLTGISSESEWRMVERDLNLVRETMAPYHVCHISTKESVSLIREAKREGLPVTCETGPHYLILADEDLDGALESDGGRFKMNPPIRSKDDRSALVEGLLDGTIDCIATDHAPHSAEEKSRGVSLSPFGIVGLETAFPILYTYLVEPGIAPLELIIDRLAYRPRAIFGGKPCLFNAGDEATFTAVSIGCDERVDSAKFLSMGKATPFAGWPIHAKVLLTMLNGSLVYENI